MRSAYPLVDLVCQRLQAGFFFSPTLVCMMSVRADIPNMVRHRALVVSTEAPPTYSSAHLFMRRSQSDNSVLGSGRIEN